MRKRNDERTAALKVFLHIGTHKTGTTTIQHFLHHHRQNLLRHGVYFPPEQHQPLMIQQSYLAEMIERGQAADVAAYCRGILAQAEAEDAQMLVLSGERMSTLAGEHIRTLGKIFAGHDVTIILYLRNLESYALSLLTQNLKHSQRSKDVVDLVGRVRCRLDYTALIGSWEAVFGDDRVTVRCFDREKDRLLTSFMECLDLDGDAFALVPRTGREVMNRSPDIATLMLLASCGLDISKADYVGFRAEYEARFEGFSSALPSLPGFAAALMHDAPIDLSHPKLGQHRALLSAPMPVPGPIDVADYLDRLGALLKTLAKYQRAKTDGGSNPLARSAARKARAGKRRFWHRR